MKKNILFILLIVSSSTAIGQIGFHIDWIAAANSSWIVKQNNFEILSDCPNIATSELAYSATLGYHSGIRFGYKWSDQWGLSIGTTYWKGGQNYSDQFTPGQPAGATALCQNPHVVDRKVKLSYIAIPIVVKYTSNSPQKARLYFTGGFQTAFLMSASDYININGTVRAEEDLEVSVDDKFQDIDFGMTLGVGYDVEITPQLSTSIGLDTYYGFADLNGKAVRDFVSKNDVDYNSSNNFRLGLQVSLNYFLAKQFMR